MDFGRRCRVVLPDLYVFVFCLLRPKQSINTHHIAIHYFRLVYPCLFTNSLLGANDFHVVSGNSAAFFRHRLFLFHNGFEMGGQEFLFYDCGFSGLLFDQLFSIFRLFLLNFPITPAFIGKETSSGIHFPARLDASMIRRFLK